MAKAGSILSPHHLGEALVAVLLREANLGALPAHDPKHPGVKVALGSIIEVPQQRPRTEPNAHLEPSRGLSFDGMHSIDCALFLERSVIAVEAKLGDTGLGPAEFCRRFVQKRPRLTRHSAGRVGGSMVALLDWNGRRSPAGQPKVQLSVGGLPVQRRWLLVVRGATWRSWSAVPHLARTLGTAQLGAVLTLDELAQHVGLDKARDLASGMASSSIRSWFSSAGESE
jgi:hypothetical protein